MATDKSSRIEREPLLISEVNSNRSGEQKPTVGHDTKPPQSELHDSGNEQMKSVIERQPYYMDKSQPTVEREPVYVEDEQITDEVEPVYLEEKPATAILEREPLYVEKEQAVLEREPLYMTEQEAVLEREPLYVEEEQAVLEREPLYVEKVQAVLEREPLYVEKEQAVLEREPLYVKQAVLEREPLYMTEQQAVPKREPLYVEEEQAVLEREPLCMTEQEAVLEREPRYVEKVQAVLERESLYVEQAVLEREPLYMTEQEAVLEREPLYVEKEQAVLEREPLYMTEQEAVLEREPLYVEKEQAVLRVEYINVEQEYCCSEVAREELYTAIPVVEQKYIHCLQDCAEPARELLYLDDIKPKYDMKNDKRGSSEYEDDIRKTSVQSYIEAVEDFDLGMEQDRESVYRPPLYGEVELGMFMNDRYGSTRSDSPTEKVPITDECILAPISCGYIEEPEIELVQEEEYLEEVDNKPQQQEDTFMLKECCIIRKINEKRCACGRLISEHSDDVSIGDDNIEWISAFDTKKRKSFPRKIYFGLNETSGNRATASSYVRLSDDTRAELVAKYHEESWLRNYKPDILISFLGGCGKDFISKKTEDTLVEGISKILRTCDSLFFTRASQMGLTRLVGRICNSHTQRWKSGYVNQCVGFMPWGCVAQREMLDGCQGDDIIEYNHCNDSLSLDPNHQKFFLVDNGSVNQFGTEVELRTRLQQFMASKRICNGKPNTGEIPSINLLVGGGLTSITSMHAAVFPDNEVTKGVIIPMVILKNSGRAADVLSDVFESDSTHMKWKHRKYMKYRSINLMLATKNAAIKYLDLDLKEVPNLKTLSLVRECVENHSEKIFVCDVEKPDRDLYEDILMACLQVSFFDKTTSSVSNLPIHRKIRINMELKQVEKARELIKRGGKAIYYPMDDSLLRCNPRIVEELLDIYNFNVEEYTKDSLTHLYTSDEYKDTRGGRRWIEYFKKKFPFQMKIEVTSSDENSTATTDFTTLDINKAIQFLTDETVSDDLHVMSDENITYRQEKINATQALLINSVFINQPSLTRVFWKYDKYNPLSNALLAYHLQSSIAKLYKQGSLIPHQLNESIEYFKEKIVQLLTCYYDTDKEMAAKVINRKISMWKDRTLVDIAGDFKTKFFIEKAATQTVISDAWKGQDPDRKYFMEKLNKRSKEECCIPGNFFGLCHFINQSMGTPSRKLFMHMLMYVLSVGMFSYFLLVKDSPAHVPIKWIMFVMVCSLALDECRQVTDFGKTSLWLNTKIWISDPWNVLDILCILLYFGGFGAGFYSRLTSLSIYSVFLALYCIKFTQFLRISSRIGPYMVMIFQMVSHMRSFLIVLMIAVFGYGIFMTALLFPYSNASWEILFKVLFRPYFLVFGELGIDSHELRSSTTVFGTNKVSRVSEVMVILGMAMFMLFANVLLLNLLIAAFSNIYETVRSTSYQIWRFEQFELLCEFKKKPLLPFPFSIPENLCMIFKYCKQRKKKQEIENKPSREEVREIANFERFCMMKLWPSLSSDGENESQNAEEKVLSALGGLAKDMNESDKTSMGIVLAQKEQLRKRVEAVKEGVLDRLEKTEDRLDHRLDAVEDMLKRLNTMIEQVADKTGKL